MWRYYQQQGFCYNGTRITSLNRGALATAGPRSTAGLGLQGPHRQGTVGRPESYGSWTQGKFRLCAPDLHRDEAPAVDVYGNGGFVQERRDEDGTIGQVARHRDRGDPRVVLLLILRSGLGRKCSGFWPWSGAARAPGRPSGQAAPFGSLCGFATLPTLAWRQNKRQNERRAPQGGRYGRLRVAGRVPVALVNFCDRGTHNAGQLKMLTRRQAPVHNDKGLAPRSKSVCLKLLASRALARWWSAGFRPDPEGRASY